MPFPASKVPSLSVSRRAPASHCSTPRLTKPSPHTLRRHALVQASVFSLLPSSHSSPVSGLPFPQKAPEVQSGSHAFHVHDWVAAALLHERVRAVCTCAELQVPSWSLAIPVPGVQPRVPSVFTYVCKFESQTSPLRAPSKHTLEKGQAE